MVTPDNLPVTRREHETLRVAVFGNGKPGLSGDVREMKKIIEKIEKTQEIEAAANRKLRDEWVAVQHQFKGAKLVLWIIAAIIGVAGTFGGATIASLMREILTRLP